MQVLRDAWYPLRTAPVVFIAAVLSLGLGIGANTAIFSLIDGLLLRTLPVEEPDRLVLITSGERDSKSWSNPFWEAFRELGLFESTFAWRSTRFDVAESGQQEWVDGLWASGEFFDALGVPAVMGRTIKEIDDQPGGGSDGSVVVISHGFWQRRFGGSPSILGQTVTVERLPFTIIGVTPPEFVGLNVGFRFDVAIPLRTASLMPKFERRLESRFSSWLMVAARLRPGQSVETATVALGQVQPRIREATLPNYSQAERREAYLRDPLRAVSVASGVSFLKRLYGRPLGVLMVLVALVLCIASVNVANLLLARAAERRREFGIRLALGASRMHLLRQMLAESVLLSMGGIGVGLLIGQWGSHVLVQELSAQYMGNPFVPGPTTVFLDLSLNTKLLAVTAGIGFVTTVLFGTAPAWRAAHNDPIESLHGQRPGLMTSKRIGGGRLFVVAQMAFSFVLLVAAGLFIRTFSELADLRLGFEPGPVLIVDVDMRRQPVDPAEHPALFRRLHEAAGAVPGVASAAWSMTTPISGAAMMTSVEFPGGPPIVAQGLSVHKNLVSPEWFRTLGTRLLTGRDFTTRDRAGAPPVVIVNEAFAWKFVNGANPVGRVLQQGLPEVGEAILEIVGVVEDTVYRSVREAAPPTIYLPIQQAEARDLGSFPISNVVVRAAAGSAESVASNVAAALSEVDSELAISTVPMASRIRASYNHERILAMLATMFGGLALLLAMLGLYGVTSYTVTRRRSEIAIRMAVGASRAFVFRMVLERVALLAAIGSALGGLVSFSAGKFVQSLLFGLPARDPQVFAVAGAVLIVTALAAGFLPARHATRLSPMHALREN